jgi:dienelactone hydrolase
VQRLLRMRLKRGIGISCLFLLFAWLTSSAFAQEPTGATLSVPAVVLDGSNPGIKVAGLQPNEIVRIHVLRSLEKWKDEGGTWQRVRQSLHAYADFKAAADGIVNVDTQAPIHGSYTKVDPLGLLRTGYRFGDAALKGVLAFPEEPLAAARGSKVWVKLERDGKVAAEAVFELEYKAQGVEVAQARGDGWHAVYARPGGGKSLPVVLSLHGSEGGSINKATDRAIQFASQGFAAVGVNYFAYQFEAVEGIPSNHAEIKLEIFESIREWLKSRPEVDMNRIHLVGTSKGAEFALLAATRFDWITSVVAVVPSDIVWEGYSEGGSKGTASSSWSIGGQPLPFVPLFPFDPKQEGLYRTNSDRYERSRAFYTDRVGPARIPVENAKARILLLAGDRDEVWASGAMARNIVERMVFAGKADQVEVKIYPTAGHQIAGTGTFPVRLYGEQSPDPEAKDIVAEGEAAADAWRRTLLFLKK